MKEQGSMDKKSLFIVAVALLCAVPAYAGGDTVSLITVPAPTTTVGQGGVVSPYKGTVTVYPPGTYPQTGGQYPQVQYVNGVMVVPYRPNIQPQVNPQSQVTQIKPCPSQMTAYGQTYVLSSVDEWRKWQQQMAQYCQQNNCRVYVYRQNGVYQPPVQQQQQQPQYANLNQYDLQYYQMNNQYELERLKLQQQKQMYDEQMAFQREQYEAQRKAQQDQMNYQRNVQMASMFGAMIPMFVAVTQQPRY
jgi:hypothetical protein